MRFKPTYASLVIACLFGFVALSGDTNMSSPWRILGDRRVFDSVGELERFFQTQDIPIEVENRQTHGKKFVFVTAAPYTGVDSLDFYCYIEGSTNLSLYAVIIIPHSKSRKVSIHDRDGRLEVEHEGQLVLTLIGPPRESMGKLHSQKPTAAKNGK